MSLLPFLVYLQYSSNTTVPGECLVLYTVWFTVILNANEVFRDPDAISRFMGLFGAAEKTCCAYEPMKLFIDEILSKC